MPTSTQYKQLKINKLTSAQYDSAILSGVIGANELSLLTDVEYAKVATVVDSTDTTYSVTLEDNTIYKNTSAGVTTLTVTEPSGTIDSNFCSEIVFTSGSTATIVTPNANIMWIGDNVSETQGFVPRANCRYSIMLTYDGVNLRGIIQGVSLS